MGCQQSKPGYVLQVRPARQSLSEGVRGMGVADDTSEGGSVAAPGAGSVRRRSSARRRTSKRLSHAHTQSKGKITSRAGSFSGVSVVGPKWTAANFQMDKVCVCV